MRLHQSLAKILITKCPAIALKWIEEDEEESNPMRKGSLLDQLVFNEPNYHVVVAHLKSGERKGELATDWKGSEAKAIRKEMQAKGMTACFQHELDAAQSLAGAVRARLLEAGAELRGNMCPRQLYIEWETEHGVPAGGTPDLIILHGSDPDNPLRADTVDLKRTDANPEWLERQIDNMCWDQQGVAYQEAVHRHWPTTQGRGQHWILAADPKAQDVQLYPVGEQYMAIGRAKWQKAQIEFERCVASGEWPFYASRTLNPPEYVKKKWM